MIVGLDSLDDSANYVHIADVKGNIDYYCPCCKGLIKPRAYKKNNDYQVQPHFYHESGGCSEESFVHYICKTWLFEKGCKFKVNNIVYTVLSIETEKTLHTSFGDYRPDIIVNTESGKTFFFEIKYANRKTELYAPKWDELGNDVVEVDAREFINNKHNCSIPEFKLIYCDGECFIKSYSRTDYENTIAKRKLEWKRQDKLNYKIQWERLDWFWQSLFNYKNKTQDINNVIRCFKTLDFTDMDFVISLVKKMSCQDLYQELIPVINVAFYKQIESYDIAPYENVKLIQESPRIFYIAFQICSIGNCFWYNSCFINKKIEYYGKNILKIFDNFVHSQEFNDFIMTQCPCMNEIKEYKYKKILTHENVNFYLRGRCAVHWNYDSKRFSRIFNSLEDINIKSFIIGYRTLSDILKDGYLRRNLTKSEHKTYIEKYDNEYKDYLRVHYIVNRINACKNKYWNASFNSNTKVITIYLNIGYISDSYCLNISKMNTKQETFKNVKLRMNILIDNAMKYNFKERVMEVK